ncbi:MAG: PEPxxWA-CTERM sorting domain-containing protein [Sphingomonadaceae bacterium]
MIKGIRNAALALAGTAAMLAAATAADATIITFSYNLSGVPQATGSFTVAPGASGLLTYADLTAFEVSLFGFTYTLADVLPLTDYVWFGYDTNLGTFVTSGDLCGFAGCGFFASLSAISSTADFGFFFTPLPAGQFGNYGPFLLGSFDEVTFGVIPEPGTWALMIAGFGLVGLAARRRRIAQVA